MPGFLDRVKSGAERAAFEADRLRRTTQAKSALRALEGDLENLVDALGKQALELYDAGSLTQPELLASCASIETLRGQITAQASEIEQIQQEKPPGDAGEEEEQEEKQVSPEAPAPPQAEPPASLCPSCSSPLVAGAKFCQECGASTGEA